MDKTELVRKLNSVGKAVFVEYYSTFQSYAAGRISRDRCIAHLVSNNVSNENGAAIRCGNAKRIFEEDMQHQALLIVSESNRLSYEVVSRAKQLVNQ